MTTLIAIAHLVGAFVALFILSIIWLFIVFWWGDKSEARAEVELSIALGVTVEKLKSKEMVPQVLKLQGERFSSELLRNRLSDLCGWFRAVCGWIVALLVIGILLGVAWFTFTETLNNAVFAWVVVPIALTFYLIDAAFMLFCRLLTGRYPGQARHARKELAKFIKTQQAS